MLRPYPFTRAIMSTNSTFSYSIGYYFVRNRRDKSPYELWYKKVPPLSSNLRTIDKIKSKLTNRGFPAMFVGYPPNHSNDVFQFMVFSRRSIITSRNNISLNKSYGDFMKVPDNEISLFIAPIPEDNTSDLDDDVDLGIEILRGVRDQQVYTCTRCGRSGHVAADCYQLRSATNDSDLDDDDPLSTVVRLQPPVNPPAIPIDPLPATDDDVTVAADYIDANDDTDDSDDTVASFSPRVSGVHRVHYCQSVDYKRDTKIIKEIRK
jgi:hypothetical protein